MSAMMGVLVEEAGSRWVVVRGRKNGVAKDFFFSFFSFYLLLLIRGFKWP